MEENDSIRNKAQEFNDKMKQIGEKLEIPKENRIIAIDFKDNIKLGGALERNSVFVLTIQDKEGTISHVVIDKDVNKIADIDKYGKIELSPSEMQKWEAFIGKKGEQRVDQKERYDFDKEYYLEEYKPKENEKGKSPNGNDKEPEKDTDKKENKSNSLEDERKKEAAKSLKTDESEIKAMIKIEDRETFGQAINKKLYADAYIVRYGNNKTKIMQVGANGKLSELSGLESSEFNSEVIEQLNIKNTQKNSKIKAGDLTTIKTEDEKYNYVVVKEHDSEKGIVIVNSTNQTKAYTFDDEGKDNLQEIEASIKYEVEEKNKEKNASKSNKNTGENDGGRKIDEEKEQEDDEERTPWGDAEARRRH